MGDLISRQNAINELEKLALEMERWTELFQIQARGVLTARNIIEDLPSTNQWIPCNERLPSGQENVIVTIYDDHSDTPWEYTTNAWHIDGVWIADNDIVCGSVIAWMPLPQPWKGKE